MDQTIEVQAGAETVGRFSISSVETQTSTRSGRPVKRLTANVRASGRAIHDDFQARLGQPPADGFCARDPESGEEKLWDIHLQSWSEMSDHYSYALVLDEKERLTLEKLAIDGMEFSPTRSKETFNTTSVRIGAQITVDADQRARLLALMDGNGYFPVVLHGINETPIEMRFGMCAWSEHGQEWKYLLTLVDKRADADRPSQNTILDLWRENRTNSLLYRAALLDEVLSMLEGKGILTTSEISAAKDRAEAQHGERERRLFQAVDVDRLDIL
jgi:hypothetical protein